MSTPLVGEIVAPIPANAPSLPRHPTLGEPSNGWTYRDVEGRPLAHVMRFDLGFKPGSAKMNKAILPLTLWRKPDETMKWEWKTLPAPRPLYRLDQIVSSAKDDRVILICEGEKAADAAATLFTDLQVTTPMNGAMAPDKTDWSPCAGRNCIIASDLDDPGAKFAEAVIKQLRQAGAASIRILDLTGLATASWRDGVKTIRPPEAIKVGYDLADSREDGWTAETVRAALEKTPEMLKKVEDVEGVEEASRATPICDGMPGWNFECDEVGVWKWEERFNPRTKTMEEQRHFVCGPLRIIGFARDHDSEDWGRVVELTDPDGRVRRILIRAKDFAGQGTDVFKRLMSAGLQFLANRAGKEHLLEYLLGSKPQERLTHTRQPGWVGETFALPDVSFGPHGVICDLGTNSHRYKTHGSYSAWQEMAGLAVGNSRLVFAVSAAFAGPLIHPLKQEGGGIHFVGSMGGGKSTIAKLAGSVWGGNGRQTYALSWSGSDSGHEAIAVQANDTLLVLDEIGRADPALLGTIIYQQTNGTGKNRSDLDSTPKDVKFFTLMVISTGEMTVSEAISASPRGGRAMAGQLVRLLDIPADVDDELGVFECLHGFESSRAFATHLETVLQENFGYAARDFLDHLTMDLPAAKEAVGGVIKGFLAKVCPQQASRQVQRAAARFALIAGAGELAAAYGVLPWPRGEALTAARSCFNDWLANQCGTAEPQEKVEAVRTVQQFISLHGAARFEPLDIDQDANSYRRVISNRAGYSRRTETGEEFYILPEVWRSEVCKGRHADQVAKYLAAADLLVTSEPGRLTRKMRVPDQPKPIRCYAVRPDILAWSSSGEKDDVGWGDI